MFSFFSRPAGRLHLSQRPLQPICQKTPGQPAANLQPASVVVSICLSIYRIGTTSAPFRPPSLHVVSISSPLFPRAGLIQRGSCSFDLISKSPVLCRPPTMYGARVPCSCSVMMPANPLQIPQSGNVGSLSSPRLPVLPFSVLSSAQRLSLPS